MKDEKNTRLFLWSRLRDSMNLIRNHLEEFNLNDEQSDRDSSMKKFKFQNASSVQRSGNNDDKSSHF